MVTYHRLPIRMLGNRLNTLATIWEHLIYMGRIALGLRDVLLNQQQNQIIRRPKAALISFTHNHFHLRNPWVIALWSLIFPGFGHISCGSKLKGGFLFAGELLINYKAHINMALLFSFTGKFDQAKEVLDPQWLLIYCPVLILSVWDSYRLAVEYNKLSVLADRAASPITPTVVGAISIDTLEKRNPWVSAAWSMLLPGLGHICQSQIATATYLLVASISIIILSHVLPAIGYTAIGDFQQAKVILDWQWFLNLPSLYGFAAWDSYREAVEINKLFEIEQARYFKNNFQQYVFKIPFQTMEG